MNNQKLISVKDFSPEELRKWQMKLLEILVYFRDFCVENNLTFYLSAGTLLGAIRHKGFIPWDDDLDVIMFREDYDKMIELWNKKADTSRFKCSVTNKDACARYPMATIRNVNTTCIYDHSVNDDICQGLKIDVEFFDVMPKGWLSNRIYTICEVLLGLFNSQRIPQRKPWIIKVGSRVLLTLFPTQKARWFVSSLCTKYITKFNPPKEGDYVRYLSCKPRKVEYFKDVVWVEFEGERMPIPSGYDECLTLSYGDYMSLPPEKDRTPATDNLVFYDLDHSYKDYRGVYYCCKK